MHHDLVTYAHWEVMVMLGCKNQNKKPYNLNNVQHGNFS